MKKLFISFAAVLIVLSLSGFVKRTSYPPTILCAPNPPLEEIDYIYQTPDGFLTPVGQYCDPQLDGIGTIRYKTVQYHLVDYPNLYSDAPPEWPNLSFTTGIVALSFNPKASMGLDGWPINGGMDCRTLIIQTGSIGKDVAWGYEVVLWDKTGTWRKYFYQDTVLPNHTYRYRLISHTFAEAWITNGAFEISVENYDGYTDQSVSIGIKNIQCDTRINR